MFLWDQARPKPLPTITLQKKVSSKYFNIEKKKNYQEKILLMKCELTLLTGG